MDTPTQNPSEPTQISDDAILERLALQTQGAIHSIQMHILDLDLKAGGGHAAPALAALAALTEALMLHYVKERQIFNAKHHAKFECVPREIWDQCKKMVERCAECGLAHDEQAPEGRARCGACGKGI